MPKNIFTSSLFMRRIFRSQPAQLRKRRADKPKPTKRKPEKWRDLCCG